MIYVISFDSLLFHEKKNIYIYTNYKNYYKKDNMENFFHINVREEKIKIIWKSILDKISSLLF